MKDWFTTILGIVLLSAVMTFATYDAYASESSDNSIVDDSIEKNSEDERDVLILPISASCVKWDNALRTLKEQWSEVPVAMGEVRVRNLKTGAIDTGDLYITVEVKHPNRFSLLFVLEDQNIACFLGAGVGFGPYVGQGVEDSI